MTKKLSTSEKASHVAGKYSTRNQIIAGLFLIASVVITWFFIKSQNNNKESQIHKIKEQKVDTGSINNYSIGRDNVRNSNTETITNNKVEQKNSQNGNIQIGKENASK